MEKEITFEDIKSFDEKFNDDPSLKISKNAVMRNGVFNAAFNSEEARNVSFTFSDEVKNIGTITDQKSSGRCWMFSGLNVLRIAAMKKLHVSDFEFSESYLMFWDKLEKCNCQLEATLSTLDEEDNSRLFDYVMTMGGQQDGGFWAFFTALVNKYGVCPKSAMPESVPSSMSAEMDAVLSHKMSQFCSKLREEHRNGASEEDLRKEKGEMLAEIYKILCVCLGKPVESFTYEWKANPDEKKKGKKDEADEKKESKDEKKDEKKKKNAKDKWCVFKGTPLEFYKKFVGLDLNDYIVLTHAPVRGFEYGKNYAVEYAINVEGTPVHSFVNVPLDVLKKAAIDSIKHDEALWFDCDVLAFSIRKEGYLADNLIDLEDLFRSDFKFDKGESLIFRNTMANHAMVLAGVNLDKKGKPNRWKVENSWGSIVGKAGIFVMSDSWFDRFVYGLVVNKKYLPKDVIEASKQEPIMLPAWSPVSGC